MGAVGGGRISLSGCFSVPKGRLAVLPGSLPFFLPSFLLCGGFALPSGFTVGHLLDNIFCLIPHCRWVVSRSQQGEGVSGYVVKHVKPIGQLLVCPFFRLHCFLPN